MLKFTVNGQDIACEYDLTASDSAGYPEVVFSFCDDWSGLSKTAQFTQNGSTVNVLLNGDRCTLPSELSAGDAEVSVFGSKSGGSLRITTVSCRVNIRKSGFVSDGNDVIPPTPDLYSQLLSKIDDALSGIPTKISSFENDSGYITSDALPKNNSELTNDTGYITEETLPVRVSQLENDSGFITVDSLPENISELYNDSGYITSAALPKNVSELYNDTEYITSAALPKYTSELYNDSGYATENYVNTLIGDINSALDSLLAIQEELIERGESV